jgi:hypothetical protein
MQSINFDLGELLVIQLLIESMLESQPNPLVSVEDLMLSIALRSAQTKVNEAIKKENEANA